MGEVVEVQFNPHGPVAKCPHCDSTTWHIKLDAFGKQWENITGTECACCGFVIDWVNAEKVEKQKP